MSSFMCFNPDLEENNRCISSKKIFDYGKTIEDCEKYCSTENNNFLKPYIIRPKNMKDNNNVVAIYKPPYMNVSVGLNIISSENMMNIILMNKLINIFKKIKESNEKEEIKNEFILFIDNFIKLSGIIINAYNRPDNISSMNLKKSEIINKLISLYNSHFSNKIDFPTDSKNIFIVYYIIVVSILNKLNKKIDIEKFKSEINLDSLKYLYHCINKNDQSLNDDLDIEKEYAPYNFLDPKNKIGSRSIMNWILNNHYLNKFPITKDSTRGFGICNRLDIPTSGIILCSLNNNSYSQIMEEISNHNNTKIYTALLNGNLQNRKIITNTIDKSLIKHSLGFEYNKLAEKNMNNHTTIIYPYIIYKDELENFYTLCFIRILSGVHHQIRVHCSSIGHNVVSDEVYNCLNSNEDFNLINKNLALCPRLFLHSTNYIIKLNNIEYNFFCNLPDDLKNTLDKLKIVRRMIPKGFRINNGDDYNMTIKKLFIHLIKHKFFFYKVKRRNFN